MNVMRTAMYIPANNAKFVAKAADIPADIITFDIEDAVPPQEKENARKMTAENLVAAGKNGAEVYVRVNGWHTEYTNDDLEAVVYPGLNGITLPKTRNADDVKRLDWKISELEQRRGIPAGSVRISILLETAMGMVHAYECCTASDRVDSVFFGAVDYCADMRIKRTNLAKEQMVARTIVCHAARAAGIVAMDAPFADFSNMDDFRQNTLDGIGMGFEVAHELYSPTQEEVELAAKTKKFFEEEGLAKGLASVSMDGAMVDTPVYVSACEVLDRAAAIKEKEAARK